MLFFFLIFILYQISVITKINSTTIKKKINIEVPFKVINDRIFIDAKINGVPKLFMIDTGASTSSIFFDDNEIENSIFSNYLLGFDINHTIFVSKVINVEKFNLGEILLSNIYFRKMSLDNRNIDGIIGNNILKNFSLFVNFDKRMIYFSTIKGENIIGELPIKAENNKLYINAIDNKVAFIIDTGANAVISMDSASSADTKNFRKVNGTMLRGLKSENLAEEYIGIIRNFTIGQIVVPEVEVYVSSNARNLIGSKFLKNYNFKLDYLNNTILLNPRVNQNFILNEYGIRFSEKGGVDYIIENSDAEKNGFLITDKILKINDSIFDFKKHSDINKYKNVKVEVLRKIKKRKVLYLEKR